MKISAHVNLVSFNKADVFLYDVSCRLRCQKITFLKRDSAVDMFAWVI